MSFNLLANTVKAPYRNELTRCLFAIENRIEMKWCNLKHKYFHYRMTLAVKFGEKLAKLLEPKIWRHRNFYPNFEVIVGVKVWNFQDFVKLSARIINSEDNLQLSKFFWFESLQTFEVENSNQSLRLNWIRKQSHKVWTLYWNFLMKTFAC